MTAIDPPPGRPTFYSIRNCRRCGTPMRQLEDIAVRKRWACPDCGRRER